MTEPVSPEPDPVPMVVCLPFSGFWELMQMPGSVQLMGSCGHRVWLSTSGQEFVRWRKGRMHREARLVCKPCAESKGLLGDRENEVVPGGRDELRDWVARGLATQAALDRLFERFNVKKDD